MDTHKNARLTPKGREDMVLAVVDCGMFKAEAARQFNTTPKTVAKWVNRFLAEGVDGLQDRSSRPLSSASQTPLATRERVEVLRRQRYTGKQIATELAISPATVSRILRQLGLNRLSALEPAEPIRRYEREKPGELIISTSKSSANSIRSATVSLVTAEDRAIAGAWVGSMSTSASTMHLGSPSPRSCRARRNEVRLPF
jgi:transposase